jgi:phospho-N-acetylmuramoyl-pentapeptide-transferase
VLTLMDAGGAAMLVAVVVTPLLITWARRQRIGQHIREDGPPTHTAKAGTPTMGGIAIILALAVGFCVSHVGTGAPFYRSGVLIVLTVVAFGVVGFLDDYIKIRHQRSLGLNKRAKLIGQLVAGVGFSLLALYWAGVSTAISFTRFTMPGWHLGAAAWVIFATLVLVGSSNAVNLTDGLDGLAGGSATFCFSVLAIIGYWQFRHFAIYHVMPALDMALCAVALAGGCLGFLWFNAAPARIIMGDTGSLAIGSGLAALCLLMNLDLLLPIIGGLFVIVTLSVIIQVVSFRLFGRRVFRMAPLHHHFEMLGWPETTVIVRFWILAGLFAALGLGVFYGTYLTVAKVA